VSTRTRAASKERIFIIVHWRGLLFAVFVLAVFGAAHLSPVPQDETQLLGIALVAAGVVILIQSNGNLRGVEVEVLACDPAPAGGLATARLRVRNGSKQDRWGLEVRPWHGLKHWRRSAMVHIPVLKAGQFLDFDLSWSAGSRGVHKLPAVWVASQQPFRLCVSWKTFSSPRELLVYPRPAGRAWKSGLLPGEGDGAKSGSNSAEGGDVIGHTAYVQGDPISRIDWRIMAKTGKLWVRKLESPQRGRVLLRWEDTSADLHDEARLEQLSFWVDQCLREGCSFRLSLPALSLADGTSPRACREALARWKQPQV
jgi:uncharacterized protein (DUF58 family)